MTTEFKYDVAITLLGADEPYARHLEAEISRVVRGDVFLYSRQAEELAVTGDLVDEFTRVFSRGARIVVIVYRPGWGETPYTSIEHDAIKARRTRETDLRWVVVVSLDGPPHAPEWYGATLRLEPAVFSPEAIAAVVAERVAVAGGQVGEEGPLEKARRLREEQQRRTEIAGRLMHEGPDRLEREANALFAQLKRHAEEISADSGTEVMRFEERQRRCAVNHRWGSLISEWHRPYRNTLADSSLAVSIRNRPTSLYGAVYDMMGREDRLLVTTEFTLQLDDADVWGWKPTSMVRQLRTRTFFTTDALADWAISELLEQMQGEEP